MFEPSQIEERESLFKITSVRKEFLLVLIQLNLGLLFSVIEGGLSGHCLI